MKNLLLILLSISISFGIAKVPEEIKEEIVSLPPLDEQKFESMYKSLEMYDFEEKQMINNIMRSYEFFKQNKYKSALAVLNKVDIQKLKALPREEFTKQLISMVNDTYAFGGEYVKAFNLYEYQILNFPISKFEYSKRQFSGLLNNYLEVAENLGLRIKALVFLDELIERENIDITHELFMDIIRLSREEGLYDIALKYVEGLYKFRMQDNKFDYFEYYITLSDIYYLQNDIELANYYLNKSKNSIERGYQEIIFNFKKSNYEKEKSDYNLAIYYLTQILKDSLFYDYNLSEVKVDDVYKELSEIYALKGDIQKVKEFIKKHDKKSDSLTLFKINPSKIKLKLMRNHTQNLEKLANDYLTYANRYGNYENRLEAYEILYKYYDQIEDLKKSNQYLKQYVFLFKNLNNNTKRLFIEKTKEEYSNKFAQAEIYYEEAQNKKLIILAVVILVALIAIGAYYWNKFKKKRQEEKELISESTKLITVNKELEKINQEITINQTILQDYSEFQDNMLRVLIHDINTPIASVALSANTLIDFGDKLSEKEKKQIYSRIKELSGLANKIIVDQNEWLMRREEQASYEPEYLDLDKHLQELVRYNKLSAAGKKIQLNLDLSEQIIYTDKYMLEIVIRNLISNSIKFTKVGGNIKVICRSRENFVDIIIEDNGIGFKEEILKKINSGEEVESTDGTAGERGTGIGLKITKDFVERMGSKLIIDSKKDKGTRISFSLEKVD